MPYAFRDVFCLFVGRIFAWGILGIAIGTACGGRATPDADAGTGSGTGGASGTGGTTGTAGATMGTGGAGGATAGTCGTTTGAGGSGITGGSGGAGGAPDFGACSAPDQCTLVPNMCCACGDLVSGQVEAINSGKVAEAFKLRCGDPAPPCPPCEYARRISDYFMARCESGRCRVFDIRNDPTYTQCGCNDDCVLRKGLACCECQTPGGWVLLSRAGAARITRETCAADTVCPSCTPVPPSNMTPFCFVGVCRLTSSTPSSTP